MRSENSLPPVLWADDWTPSVVEGGRLNLRAFPSLAFELASRDTDELIVEAGNVTDLGEALTVILRDCYRARDFTYALSQHRDFRM